MSPQPPAAPHALASLIAPRLTLTLTLTLTSILIAFLALAPPACFAQANAPDSSPSAALSAALAAACRADQTQFASYLTAASSAAFRAISETQRVAFLRRFSLADGAGKPLISADSANREVLRCQAPEVTVEFRFGDARVAENLAFIPVEVVSSGRTQFGLVRENGGWRLLSLGLVLLDVPQLSKEWAREAAEQAIAANETAAIDALHSLHDALELYRRAFGMLPDSLARLGPAPKNEISPDQASLVDQHLAAGSANGYLFRYRTVAAQATGEAQFELTAIPENYGSSGLRSFLLDAAGKIHAADRQGTAASADDPLLESNPAPAPPSSSSIIDPR